MSGTTGNERLQRWVDDWAAILQPAAIHWCDGSAAEYEDLCQQLVASGTFTKLDEAKRPNSYWAHSDPGDVARVEDRTFICSAEQADAGPNNNWRDPVEMRAALRRLYTGAMRNRTLYVPAALEAVVDEHVAVTTRNEAALAQIAQINVELLGRRALR